MTQPQPLDGEQGDSTRCKCGHVYADHDAGCCWAYGDNISDERQCPCSWMEPAS